MKHLITIDLNGSTYVTPDSIRTLETKCGHVFSFQEKIFLANLGTTQQLLEILVNSQTYVRVTKQFEKADFIKRKVEILAKKKDDVLVLATAKIYKNVLPQKVVEEVRSRNNGIGVILSRHHLWIHRKIKRIGYDIDRSGLFRSYELLYNNHVAADITEILLKQGIS